MERDEIIEFLKNELNVSIGIDETMESFNGEHLTISVDISIGDDLIASDSDSISIDYLLS